MKKALFYLPVVTPSWFSSVILPLLRSLQGEAETHVLATPLWRNTGLDPDQLEDCAELPDVYWHLVDGDGHKSLRTSPEDPDGLVDFIRAIDPDYVFARSADIETPARFPGKLVHLMEPGSLPLSRRSAWLSLQRDFWCWGEMPELTDTDRAMIEEIFADVWARMRDLTENSWEFSPSRSEALKSLGLPEDRKIIAVPLEYEHEECFTWFHSRFETNLALVEYLAQNLDDEFVLAVAEHPLNGLHVDNSELYRAIEGMGPRARLLVNPKGKYHQTDLLVKHCDGLVIQNTKVIYSAAYFGKPVLRLAHRPTATWLGAHTELETFLSAVREGRAGSTEAQARLWFGCHQIHDVFNPKTISGSELLDRVDRPFAAERLKAGLERFEAYHRKLGLVE